MEKMYAHGGTGKERGNTKGEKDREWNRKEQIASWYPNERIHIYSRHGNELPHQNGPAFHAYLLICPRRRYR